MGLRLCALVLLASLSTSPALAQNAATQTVRIDSIPPGHRWWHGSAEAPQEGCAPPCAQVVGATTAIGLGRDRAPLRAHRWHSLRIDGPSVLRLELASHEDLRIAGFALIGSALGAAAVTAVATVMTQPPPSGSSLDFGPSFHVLTGAGIALLLVAVLGIPGAVLAGFRDIDSVRADPDPTPVLALSPDGATIGVAGVVD